MTAKILLRGFGPVALAIRFNYARVKFTACEPQPAKFCLVLSAGELDA